jgi:hypothetical protein
MAEFDDFDRTTTTTAIYRGDVAELKRKQHELYAERGKLPTLPELLHELLNPAPRAEDTTP